MTFSLNQEFEEVLDFFDKRNTYIKNEIDTIADKVNKKDNMDQALFIGLVRVIKFFDAYLLLVRNGYGEPAACLIRSIYETDLWMRWSMLSKKNADIYFNSGKTASYKMLKTLDEELASKHFRISGPGAPDIKMFYAILDEHKEYTKFPKISKMAEDAGFEKLHRLIYPMLSAMSHGNFMHLLERSLIKEIDFMPDELNIKPFLAIAYNLLNDCYLVCSKWIVKQKKHPAPDYKSMFAIK